MAFTFNGIGTAFYGKRDFREDGSYLTTEWVVFFIPIVPLRSLRVRPQPRGEHTFLGVVGYSSDSYAIFEKSAPNWKQVLSTYGFILLLVAWAYFVGRIAVKIDPRIFDRPASVWGLIPFWLLPALLPWALRRRARRKPQPAVLPKTRSESVEAASGHIGSL